MSLENIPRQVDVLDYHAKGYQTLVGLHSKLIKPLIICARLNLEHSDIKVHRLSLAQERTKQD